MRGRLPFDADQGETTTHHQSIALAVRNERETRDMRDERHGEEEHRTSQSRVTTVTKRVQYTPRAFGWLVG